MPRLTASCALLLLWLCGACSKPRPPEKEQPPEPQAAQHTELRDAIGRPIEKAEAVEADVLDAADRQRAAIDAQTGG